MINKRKIKLSIEINNEVKIFENVGKKDGLKIAASGKKFTSPTQNEATIEVTGLNADSIQYLLSAIGEAKKTNKFKFISLEVGRENSEYFKIFSGDILKAELGEAPDLTLTFECKTNNRNNTKIISSSSNSINLETLANQVAKNNGLQLVFSVLNKKIGNYNFIGSAQEQIENLQRIAQVSCFIDNQTLYVKPFDKALENTKRILNINSGLVGVPKATDEGVEVQFLIFNEAVIGGQLQLESKFNKSLNGDYLIKELEWDIATHDNPFFYKAICRKL